MASSPSPSPHAATILQAPPHLVLHGLHHMRPPFRAPHEASLPAARLASGAAESGPPPGGGGGSRGPRKLTRNSPTDSPT